MQRTLASETPKLIGREIKIAGWVKTRRDHGKIIFLDVRDRSGIVQVVDKFLKEEIKPEYVVSIHGKVNARPAETVNKNLPTGTVEIQAEKIEVLSKAESLPFDMGGQDLNLELPTLLDHRSLTLRHPKVSAIFKIQESIAQSFRKTLQDEDFTEIFVPTIVPSTTEGGAEVFEIEYFDHRAYLAQSPQFYKQIMIGVFERVFTIAHAYRAEPSVTTRHITEYIGLDVEMGFIDSWKELMDLAEKVVRNIFNEVNNSCKSELADLGVQPLKLGKEIARIKMREAQEIIFKRTEVDHRKEPDLSPEDEREICKWAGEKYGSNFVFITHYPTKKRPFYAMPDPEDEDYTLSFDLIGEGEEWITGGQRINSYEELVRRAKERGNDTKKLEIYLQAFRYGIPSEGGFCMGLERMTKDMLELANIRQASLFPRDMERIDGRLKGNS